MEAENQGNVSLMKRHPRWSDSVTCDVRKRNSLVHVGLYDTAAFGAIQLYRCDINVV